ncbi:MAG: GTPase, partial [Planctomycetota bacterium]
MATPTHDAQALHPTGDTIAAIASPPGRAARAIVRLSGPATFDVLDDLLTEPIDRARKIQRVRMPMAAGGCALPMLAMCTPGPRSYTGEDAAELLVAGGAVVPRLVLDRLLGHHAVRAADAGEFTARAYFAGRLSLDEAEGVASVIAADNAEQLRAAGDLVSGRFGQRVRAWADELTTLLALVEAGIDFTDQEDVVAIAPADLRARLVSMRNAIEQHAGAPAMGESDAARVVLAGETNAGKSTLFNALLGRRRAVASAERGSTRDAIAEAWSLAPIDPSPVELVDAPGFVAGTAEPAAVGAIRSADVVLHCADGAHQELPVATDATVIRVRTKADLPHAGSGALAVCALDGSGLDRLRSAVAETLRSR